MTEMNIWLDEYKNALIEVFGSRVRFFGIQGSFARGEATEKSDIDTVVILDSLTAEDLLRYEKMQKTLSVRDKLCGFISGEEEVRCWEKSDIFHLYYDTKAIIGDLGELVKKPTEEDARAACKIGASGVYHGAVHNLLYEKNDAALAALYKSASFVLRAVLFVKTGKYENKKEGLLTASTPLEHEILNTFYRLKNGEKADLFIDSKRLIEWSSTIISSL